MSDNIETVQTTDDKCENESSSSSTNNVNTSTPVRLFGQFKSSGTGFGSFGQTSSNGQSSSTSLFTTTLSKLSSTNGGGGGFGSLSTNGTGGFGSSSTSLAASLAPLSSSKSLFGETSTTTTTKLKENGEGGEENDNDNGDDENEEDENNDDEANKTTPSLFETAAEYEAKRASTHPTATIQGDTSTGEEHEVTKFQMAGKLYMYHPEQQQFVERGYGILKINESHDPSDWNKLQARIIMRLDKAFRVILNSPIFPKMTVERATERSVRFGAQDESNLRVFVIKASTIDCTNLCKELQSRIEIVERQQTSPIKNPSDSSPSTETPPIRIRKRSHSKSGSDTSETNNDLSKKSKLNQENLDETDESDEDSVESVKTSEQATSD